MLDRVEAEHTTLVACHFPEPGFGHLVRVEGRRYWQGPVEAFRGTGCSASVYAEQPPAADAL